MSIPILQTKLYILPPRSDLVLRPRLIERLNRATEQLTRGVPHKLTLISAPAGFGKSTLASTWIAPFHEAAGWSVAWLSLDEGDNDLVRVLSYLVAALQTIPPVEPVDPNNPHAPLGTETLALLHSPQPPAMETILTTLLNEIATLPDKLILVLDDYHVLIQPEIGEALAFLLDHAPPQMHVAILSREDPNLPLSRYRARRQLTELRAADLRFSAAEAAEFLNQGMGLHLSTEDVAELETRTEGWIAGLQMAALSMQGRSDYASFIQAFTGSNRFVLDYLAEEVLQQQPESIRNFLQQTAILHRLCGPLCDAVTARDDGKQTLELLERSNLFVVPLDDQRQWYRYHHLFAEVLLAHARDAQPEQMPTLHRRASEWYEAHGFRSDAIHHAFAAEDLTLAADLVELTCPTLHRSTFRSAELLAWLGALPDELIRTRPVLCVGYAWELLNGGAFAEAERWLQAAERWFPPEPLETQSDTIAAPGEAMRFMDAEELRLLPTEIASARAYLAMAHGDAAATVTFARRALDLIPVDEPIRRGPAASLLGLAYWTIGELDPAYTALTTGMESFIEAGHVLFSLSGVFGMAEIKVVQGQLNAAMELYEQALLRAEAAGGPALQGTADLHLGLSQLHHERNERDAAAHHLRKSQEMGDQAVGPVYGYHLCLAEARARHEQGDMDAALDLLDQAEDLFRYIHIPDFRPAAALKARLWLAQGQVAEALQWATEQALAVDDSLSYVREFEHITLARVLIAQSQTERDDRALHQAMGLLDRLLGAADAGQRMGRVIEILLVQALAHQAQGDLPAALVPLERALALAEPEGYVRTFVDEGMPMVALLRAAERQGMMPTYVQTLLAACEGQAPPAPTAPPSSSSSALPPAPSLIEPLSARELDVLRLLRTELTGPEIAQELMVSLNTMRTHSKNIYSKLGVNSRRAAVRRATELDLY